MPKISLVVPVYNVEDYLPQCLDSLRAQSFRDIEIVCVIDGSTDRSESIARLFARADNRVSVVTKENGGLSSARNVGADAAKGDIIMFVDSDDMLEKNACKVVAHAFEESSCDIVTFGGKAYPSFYSYPWLEDVLSPRDALYEEFDLDVLFKEKSRPYAWRTALTKQFWDSSKIRFDENLPFGEDQVFHFAVYPRAQRIRFIPDKLYLYRVDRVGSLMHSRQTNPKKMFLDHISIVDHICADWSDGGLLSKYPTELLDWAIDFLIYDAAKLPITQHADAESSFSELLRKWFDESDVNNSTLSGTQKDLAIALLKEESTESAVSAYAKSVDMDASASRQNETRQKLRRIFPMTAEGLQERLEKNHEIELWQIEESAKCARSLSILQAELSSRVSNLSE